MTANHNFIASNYLRAFDLKEIFAKYAVIYSNLHYPSEPLSSQNRNDLTLKLEAAMNEMTLLVLKMKEPKPDSEEYQKYFPNTPATFRMAQEHRVVI
jgi:hypothetical protein